MSTIKTELSFEQILEAAKSLSEAEREHLIFELSSEFKEALKKMEADYENDRAAGKTVHLVDCH